MWTELGLQTIHEDTAAFIRRGYPLSCFQDALTRLRAHGLETIVHVILGLPGESCEIMLETIRYLAGQDIQGVKLQLLHILKDTDLAAIYARCPFPLLSMEEYLDLIIDCIAPLPPEIVIHRLTGDGPKSLLVAPLWSANKRLVLGSLDKRFREGCITQGCGCPGHQYTIGNNAIRGSQETGSPRQGQKSLFPDCHFYNTNLYSIFGKPNFFPQSVSENSFPASPTKWNAHLPESNFQTRSSHESSCYYTSVQNPDQNA